MARDKEVTPAVQHEQAVKTTCCLSFYYIYPNILWINDVHIYIRYNAVVTMPGPGSLYAPPLRDITRFCQRLVG
jgi:hypothetical protein